MEGSKSPKAADCGGPREGLAGTQQRVKRKQLHEEEEEEDWDRPQNSRGNSNLSQEAGGAFTFQHSQ